MPIVLGLNRLRNRGSGSAWSHDCQLVYCLVITRAAYIAVGYRLQPALAATTATLCADVVVSTGAMQCDAMQTIRNRRRCGNCSVGNAGDVVEMVSMVRWDTNHMKWGRDEGVLGDTVDE